MFRRPAATQADDLAKVLSIIAGFQSLLWNTHVRNELLNEVGVLGHISDGANRMCGRIFKLDPDSGPSGETGITVASSSRPSPTPRPLSQSPWKGSLPEPQRPIPPEAPGKP